MKPPPLPPLPTSATTGAYSPSKVTPWVLGTIAALAAAVVIGLMFGFFVGETDAARDSVEVASTGLPSFSGPAPATFPRPPVPRPSADGNEVMHGGDGEQTSSPSAADGKDALSGLGDQPAAAVSLEAQGGAMGRTVEPDAAEAAGSAVADLRLPDAIDLFPVGNVGFEGGLSGKALLGPFPEGGLGKLRITMALPAHLSADERGAVQVERLDGETPGWRIIRKVAGLDGEQIDQAIATLQVTDLQVQIVVDPRLDLTGRSLLATSVLLLNAGDPKGWQPVRLVKPRPLAATMMLPLEGSPEPIVLPLPGPLAAVGLPDGAEVAVEVNAEEVKLVVGRDDAKHDGGAGDHEVRGQPVTIGELGPRETLVFRLAVAPRPDPDRPAALVVRPAIADSNDSPDEQAKRLRKLAAVANRDIDAVVKQLSAKWENVVKPNIEIRLLNAVSRGARTVAWLRSPLLISADFPAGLGPEPIAAAFDAYLARQGGGGGMPSSLAFWEDECGAVIERAQYGIVPETESIANWNQTYRQPLEMWWGEYGRQAREKVRRGLELLQALSRREVEVKVAKVTIHAIAPDGTRYDVPLVKFKEGQPALPPVGNAGPAGLD